MRCPRCANLNRPDQADCHRCGQSLRENDIEVRGARLPAGQSVDDRFRIVGLIGAGAMGTVYEALDLRLGRRVALKVLNPDLVESATARHRMAEEAVVLASIRHPNIVEIYDVFEWNGGLVLVLELVEGGTLAGRLKEEARLSIEQTIRLFDKILLGIEAIHAVKKVHRDLKPANILLSDPMTPKIADLGVAHNLEGRGRTKTGALIGTPEYMSPEQIKGHPVDVRTDIYACGIILYEVLAARVPFEGNTEYDILDGHVRTPPDLELLHPDTPSHVRSAVERALQKPPELRWESAADFRAALGGPTAKVQVARDGHSEIWDGIRRLEERIEQLERRADDVAAAPATALPATSSDANRRLAYGVGIGAVAVALVAGGLALSASGKKEPIPPPKPSDCLRESSSLRSLSIEPDQHIGRETLCNEFAPEFAKFLSDAPTLKAFLEAKPNPVRIHVGSANNAIAYSVQGHVLELPSSFDSSSWSALMQTLIHAKYEIDWNARGTFETTHPYADSVDQTTPLQIGGRAADLERDLPGKVVLLVKIDRAELERSLDYVEIRDPSGSTMMRIGSGSDGEFTLPLHPSYSIVFHSDSSVVKWGVKFSWSLVLRATTTAPEASASASGRRRPPRRPRPPTPPSSSRSYPH